VTTVLALHVFGHAVPTGGPAIAVAALVLGFFAVSRSDGKSGTKPGRVGRGRMHTCHRCGRQFQPEQVELLSTGEVREWIDERCPNCGWELDWGEPRKPGGSSGRW